MKFAIQINAAPWASAGADSAYQFIRAALAAEHEIVRVLFYQEAAYHGLPLAPAADEAARVGRWSLLAAESALDLVVCITAAQRRGVLASTATLETGAVAAGFRIGGLGLWVDACLQADRVLVFGG